MNNNQIQLSADVIALNIVRCNAYTVKDLIEMIPFEVDEHKASAIDLKVISLEVSLDLIEASVKDAKFNMVNVCNRIINTLDLLEGEQSQAIRDIRLLLDTGDSTSSSEKVIDSLFHMLDKF